MEISADAGGIIIAILVNVTGLGVILRGLPHKLDKVAEQLDRLIIATERAQAFEEAKRTIALQELQRRSDG